jgi:hypothetical protein
MTLTKPRAVACCIIAHAVFAYLGAEWIDINIVLLLAAICAWPFWWAALGFRELRTRAVRWSLAVGSVIYLPSIRVILLMLSSARGGPR